VPLDEREYMRSPDGDDDAYYRWLRDNGFVRSRRARRAAEPAEQTMPTIPAPDVAEQLARWARGEDCDPLY
jgi:hypothetical protein